jgi:hypothetical protein
MGATYLLHPRFINASYVSTRIPCVKNPKLRALWPPQYPHEWSPWYLPNSAQDKSAINAAGFRIDSGLGSVINDTGSMMRQ